MPLSGPRNATDVVALGESMVTCLPSRPGRFADVPAFARPGSLHHPAPTARAGPAAARASDGRRRAHRARRPRHAARPGARRSARRPRTTRHGGDCVTGQANVKAVLEEGGAGWDDAMMIRVYLTDVAHFAEFNEIYDAYFEEQRLTRPPAARTTVYVGLPAGLLVEIDALAVLG